MQFVYFASPMCSWCWGFSPVVQKLKKEYGANKIRLVLTPFRVDTTEPMDDALRNYVLGQWHKVHQTTGQAFDFRFAMPKDFIYNTTLVCLSIKAFCNQLIEQELDYMHDLQHLYYTKNQDLTNEDILIEIAEKFGLNTSQFKQDLHSELTKEELEKDFSMCQQLNVRSYPTLMLEQNDEYSVLANGYLSFTELQQRMESLTNN